MGNFIFLFEFLLTLLYNYFKSGGDYLMSMAKKIRSILLERDMTIKELSDKLGYEGSYLYNKLSRDRLTEPDLKKIADALNCDYDGIFTFRDTGKKI